MFYKYTGERPGYILYEENIIEDIVESYHMLDISMNKNIFSNNINISFGAKNIFNVKNIRSSTNNPGAHSVSDGTIALGYGTSFFTSLNIKL
tara:strand:- start:207 stop:482 length:276 start_codon:yes stop_codon:yes gene_type:complete